MTTLQQFLDPITDHTLVSVVIGCNGALFCHTEKAMHVKLSMKNFMDEQVYDVFINDNTAIVFLTQLQYDEV